MDYGAPAVGFPTILAESAYSNIALTGQGPTTVAAPSNLRVTGSRTISISLAWNDNSNNEGGFLIQRATNSRFTQNLVTFTVGPNVKTFTDTTARPNTVYYYRVQAFAGAVNSTFSNTVSTRLLG